MFENIVWEILLEIVNVNKNKLLYVYRQTEVDDVIMLLK